MKSLVDIDSSNVWMERTLRWLLPLALLASGFWFVPLAQTCRLDCIPGDLGDARFNDVILEHFHRWLIGKDASLLSPSFFYPMPGALTFSDNLWGTAWIYSGFRLLGWDRYEAFDLWYLAGYVANFVVCHWVFRRLGFSILASALGAFAFTFPLPVIATHGHAQLAYRFVIPAGLLLWHRFRQDGGWRWLGWLAVAVVAQFYIAIYLGYFMLLLIAAWAFAQWLTEGFGPRQWFSQWTRWSEPAARSELIVAVVMTTVALGALVFLMQPYLHYSKLYAFQRAPGEIATMLPRPQSYFLADTSTFWGGFSARYITSVPMRPEQQMFFGAGVLGLALFGLIRSTARSRWVALVSMLLLVLLTLSVGGHSLYMLAARIPGLASVRAISRIAVVMALPLAYLVATGVDALRLAARPWRVLVFLLAVVMFSESVATWTIKIDIEQARERIARLGNRLPSPLPAGAVIFNPLRADVAFYDTELDGVVLSQDLGLPTLNGYSGNIPPGYDPRGGDSPCRQALTRTGAATEFFAAHLKRPLPALAADRIVVIGEATCADATWRVIPFEDMKKISLRISQFASHGKSYRVHVMVHNGSAYALNTALNASEPLRLSWQKVAEGHDFVASAWTSRVEMGGSNELMPGETREVVFDVPRAPGETGRLAISAVLEGRTWLHDHGFSPGWVRLGGTP